MNQNDKLKRLRQKVAQSYQAMLRNGFVAAENAKVAERAMRIAATKRVHDHILNHHIAPAITEYLLRFQDPLAVAAERTALAMEVNVDVDVVLAEVQQMELGLYDNPLDPEYDRQQTEALQLVEGGDMSQQVDSQPNLVQREVRMC